MTIIEKMAELGYEQVPETTNGFRRRIQDKVQLSIYYNVNTLEFSGCLMVMSLIQSRNAIRGMEMAWDWLMSDLKKLEMEGIKVLWPKSK